MTGTEVAQAAKRNATAYKYIYGAKGELCTSAHIEQLIAQSPSYFSDEQKKTAARAKAGSYCADCSGYVCICANYTQYGSYGLYDIASVRTALSTVNGKVMAGNDFIPVGAVVWKQGHVGIYIGNQTVVEARSELVDVQVNDIRSRDFTQCLLLPGIQYTVYSEDAAVEEELPDSGSGYTAWTGKIVNTPSVTPQVSAANKQAAAGFGLLGNGTLVTVVGVSGDYYRIRSQAGYYGYVYSYYIGMTSAANYENQYCQWTGTANSTLGVVNIRTGPATTYAMHASVPSVSNGAAIEVLGEVLGNEDNRLWYYVRILGQYYGYVRGDLVSRLAVVSYTAWVGVAKSSTGTINIRTAPTVNSALSSLHASLVNGDTVTVTGESRGSDGMIWYSVSVSGKHVGYCRSDLITPYSENYYVEWNGVIAAPTSSANIRTAASTSASVVDGSPYANGTCVHVLGEVSGSDGFVWYHLSVNNRVGYCRCDLIATTSDYPAWWAKANTTTGTMNIRSNAGTGYALIAGCPSVENGTQVKVVDQVCGTDGFVWYKIIVKGAYQGYVKGTLVEPVDTPAYPTWVGSARSTTGVVNVRSGASTSSAVISGYPQLNNGDCFEVIGQVSGSDGYLWFYVRIMGLYYGYIRSDLVSHGVIAENTVGYASWVGVANSTTGTVNVRAGATTDSTIIVSLSNGDGVEVIGTQNGTDGYVWYQVKCSGGNGYIRSDLVIHQSNIVAGESSDETDDSVDITSARLDCPPRGVTIKECSMRSYPSEGSEYIDGLMVRTYVDLQYKVKNTGGIFWYKCKANNKSGYLPESCIRVFPKNEYCGSKWTDHNNIEVSLDGYMECSDCGYYVDILKKDDISVNGYRDILEIISHIEKLERYLYEKLIPEGVSVDPAMLDDIAICLIRILRRRSYSDKEWILISEFMYSEAYDTYLEEFRDKYPESYEMLEPYIGTATGSAPLLKTQYGALVDIEHLAATLEGYYQGFLVPAYWAGWGGDLATLMGNVQNYVNGNADADTLSVSMDMLGDMQHSFNFADICSDADAIGINQLLNDNIQNLAVSLPLSETLTQYYSNKVYESDRMQYYINDIGVTSTEELYDAIYTLMVDRSATFNGLFYANPIILKGKDSSGNLPDAYTIDSCCIAFAIYIMFPRTQE